MEHKISLNLNFRGISLKMSFLFTDCYTINSLMAKNKYQITSPLFQLFNILFKEKVMYLVVFSVLYAILPILEK